MGNATKMPEMCKWIAGADLPTFPKHAIDLIKAPEWRNCLLSEVIGPKMCPLPSVALKAHRGLYFCP
jgi:hypothetical protein